MLDHQSFRARAYFAVCETGRGALEDEEKSARCQDEAE